MKSVLAVAAVCLLLAGSALGSVISITNSTVAPSLNVVQSSTNQDSANANFMYHTGDAAPGQHQYSGEVFMNPTNFVLDKLTYRVQSGGAAVAGQAVNVELWSTNSATGSGISVLQTDAGVLPLNLADGDYVTFDLSNVALTGGSFYIVMPDLVNAGPTFQLVWGAAGANTSYGNGQIANFEPSNSNDWDTQGDDMVFFAQAAVPEPATMSLLALGALGALIRRRK